MGPAEIAIKVWRPPGRCVVRIAAVVPLAAPSAPANSSGRALVEAAMWIGAAVLSGMLGNVAHELIRSGVRRIVAKLRQGGRKQR